MEVVVEVVVVIVVLVVVVVVVVTVVLENVEFLVSKKTVDANESLGVMVKEYVGMMLEDIFELKDIVLKKEVKSNCCSIISILTKLLWVNKNHLIFIEKYLLGSLFDIFSYRVVVLDSTSSLK
jgi:hypothetical protein